MDRELRRRQSILSVAANGVMFLGMWSFLKLNLYFLLGRDSILAGIELDESIDEGTVLLISYIVAMIFSSIELFLRIFIGRRALAESRDLKKRTGYIGIAIFLIIVYIAVIIFSFYSLELNNDIFLDQLASTLVDITSLFMMLELVTSAAAIRKIQKEKAPDNSYLKSS